MDILGFIGGIFRPAVDLIDEIHTSDEEKMSLHKEIMKVKQQMSAKVLEYETKLMDAQAGIIRSEATGHSWLQRNWRPITMLTFLALVMLDSFGWLPGKGGLNQEAWTLLKIGLGGYVVGRSAEKVTSILKSKLPSEAKG